MFRIWMQRIIKTGTLAAGGTAAYYHQEEIYNTGMGAIRFGRAAVIVGKIVLDYRDTLYTVDLDRESEEYASIKSEVHQRSAERLLGLCCLNGGAFVKVGQHLGSLEYLLPHEYVKTLRILHSKAPKTNLDDILDVIREELECEPSEIFKYFESEPIGAASLAQVHRALLKDGTEVAVKVQHPCVLSHSVIDMKGMEFLVKIVSRIFPEFEFTWLVEEMKKNLPLELDFEHEGRNAEKVANMFSHLSWLKIPAIHWNLSTNRILVMDFCQGGQVNDVQYMKENGINVHEVSSKLGELYSEMIFVNGYVHCDPHPGNVLVAKNGRKAEIILLDHGLYVTLTNDFRLTYGKLWMSILNANQKAIIKYSEKLGVGELYGLFACMVTARSWEAIQSGIDRRDISSSEQTEIKNDAAKFLPEISEVLNRVPRQMLLILKTNDLLRGIEYSLDTYKNKDSFITMSRSCIRAMFNHHKQYCDTFRCRFSYGVSETWAQFKIYLYSWYLWSMTTSVGRSVFTATGSLAKLTFL